jgi:hypothetical protein
MLPGNGRKNGPVVSHRRQGAKGELLWSAAQSQTRQPGDDADFAGTPDKTGEGAPDTMSESNSEKKMTSESDLVKPKDKAPIKTHKQTKAGV